MVYVASYPASEPDRDTERRATISRFFAAIESGDASSLQTILAPDAITRWPQSNERITGANACLRVHANYPGGPPSQRIQRISGAGDVWVTELVADYAGERWYTLSIIEFTGPRIARMTDYFGPNLPAPEWRREMVEIDDSAS